MSWIRRLISLLFVISALTFVMSWAVYFNDALATFISAPFYAENLPGGPNMGALAGSALSFLLAYFVYPPAKAD